MEVDSDSDTDPLSDELNTSDEEFIDDSDVTSEDELVVARDASSDDQTPGIVSSGSEDEPNEVQGPVLRRTANRPPLPGSDDSQAGSHESQSTPSPNAAGVRHPARHRPLLSSQDSQSASEEPPEAQITTLAHEANPATGPDLDSLQNERPEPSVLDEPSCSSGPTRKRTRKSLSPVAKNNVSMTSEDDSMTCPICFEFWTTSGEHRLVALKCGHLFGLSCIERWIKQPKARCPQCNHLARKTDIRKIYARSLKVLDTSERDKALRDLAAEQEKRRHAEVETASMRMKLQLVTQESERYKQELIEHKKIIEQMRTSSRRMVGRVASQANIFSTQTASSSATQRPHFILEKTLDLCKDGGCRIMAVSNMLPLMVTSQPSNNPLFPSYGFKKISTMDLRHTEFVPVHQKALKDMAFHSHDSLVLSTALDKTVKITNVYTNSVIQSYNLEVDAWSCTWNRDDPSSFFVGLRNGGVLQFDMRMTSAHVCQLPASGKGHPVVAMQYLEKAQASTYGMCGPVSLQLSTCTFFEHKYNTEYRIHPMPVEGSFTSLCLEPVTGHMLVSCRPSAHHTKVTHLLCELTFKNLSPVPSVIDKSCSCNIVQSLEGGPFQAQLTRSRLLLNPANNSSVLVCSGDENSKAVMIWDASSSQCLTQLPASSPVLDLCSFRSDTSFCLGALTDKQLRIYRWNDP